MLGYYSVTQNHDVDLTDGHNDTYEKNHLVQKSIITETYIKILMFTTDACKANFLEVCVRD